MRPDRLIALSLLAPVGLLAGCPASPPQVAQAPAPQPGATSGTVKELIYGLATVDGPLVGATVRVTALDGTPLGTPDTHADPTNHGGSFILPDAAAPQDFRLVATGGTVKGVPFVGELRAEVRGHKRHAGYVALNPVTTLVSAYMAAHPEKSLPDATAVVKTFLAIPRTYDLGFDLQRRPETFDAAAYASQAASRGGPLGFAQVLVAELDAGGTHPVKAARPYRLAQEAAAAEEGLAVVMGKELAKGAASQAGGSAMGSVLATLGLGGDSATDAQFEAVYSKLHEIETKIDNLADAVRIDSDAIRADVTEAGYQAAAQDNIVKYVDANQHVRHNLLLIANNGNPSPTGDAAADAAARAQSQTDRQLVLDATNQFIDETYDNFQVKMHNAMAGDGVRFGLIYLWSKTINAASPYFYSYDTAMRMQRWWDYVDVVQLDAVRIQMERVRVRGGSEALAAEPLSQYQTNREVQLKLLRGMVRKTDTMDLSKMGLPVRTITLNSLPGSWTTSGGQPQEGGIWPVTVQKRDASNNPRVMLWRTRANFAGPLASSPAWVFLRNSMVFGKPGGDQFSTAARESLAAKIKRASDAAGDAANVPNATWQLPQVDDVTAIFRLAGAKGPGAFGFSLVPNMPLFAAPGQYISAWGPFLPVYNYVNPSDGSVQGFAVENYGAFQFPHVGEDPNGVALMESPLPAGVGPDTLWYE